MSTNFVMNLGKSVLNNFSMDFLKVIGNARHLMASIAPDKYMHEWNSFKWSWGYEVSLYLSILIDSLKLGGRGVTMTSSENDSPLSPSSYWDSSYLDVAVDWCSIFLVQVTSLLYYNKIADLPSSCRMVEGSPFHSIITCSDCPGLDWHASDFDQTYDRWSTPHQCNTLGSSCEGSYSDFFDDVGFGASGEHPLPCISRHLQHIFIVSSSNIWICVAWSWTTLSISSKVELLWATSTLEATCLAITGVTISSSNGGGLLASETWSPF